MKATLTLMLLIAACTSLTQLQSENHLQAKVIKIQEWQKLTLSVDVAARDGSTDLPLSSNIIQIRWNGVLIADWSAPDYEIHTLTHKLKPRNGLNTLEFSIPSTFRSNACFDNVSIKRRFTNEELVVNGQFENITLRASGWNQYNPTNALQGWKTVSGYAIGSPSFKFNKRFQTNHATLDINHLQVYQVFQIDITEDEEN